MEKMIIEFIVEGVPPKKHGEKSMWARDDEAPKVALLRKKALEARTRYQVHDCFHSSVALELTIFTPRNQLESIGDLDNFITGVCDGLQAADSQAFPYLHKIFMEPGLEKINPRYAILIDDDAKVVSINAKKVGLKKEGKTYYKVAVETVQTSSIGE